MLSDLVIREPALIGKDNQSCTKMCNNLVMDKRSKHIDTFYQRLLLHFTRERVENGKVGVHYTRTDDKAADILTKSLSVENIVMHYFYNYTYWTNSSSSCACLSSISFAYFMFCCKRISWSTIYGMQEVTG